MIASLGKLGIGGAQFGMPYGITSDGKRPGPEEVSRILDQAHAGGVAFLDTAPAYGNSEEVIGLTGLTARFSIVSKTPKALRQIPVTDLPSQIRQSIEQSLCRLRTDRLDAVLVHDAEDLLGASGAACWAVLEDIRKQGLCARIGVSVYRAEEISVIADRFPIELIQAPYNILDHRLGRGGPFKRLAEKGIAIHARSLFLQGLLLAEPERIPDRFAPVAHAVAELHTWAHDRGASPLQVILADAMQRPEIECCIFGVHSSDELQSILAAAACAGDADKIGDFELSSPLDERFLDPSRWSRPF